MALEEVTDAVEVVGDADFQRLLAGLDEVAERADAQVRALLTRADLQWLPPRLRSDANADLQRAAKASTLFHAVMDRVDAENGPRRRLLATCDAYALSVAVLEQRSRQLGALSEAGVTAVANVIVAFVRLLYRNAAEPAGRLEKELITLERELTKARKKVGETQAQGIINGLLTAVTSFIPHVGLLGRMLIRVARMGVDAIVDEALGPRGASASRATQHTLLQIAENHKGLNEAAKKFVKGGGGAFTALSDLAEIDQAGQIGAALQARYREVETLLVRLLENLGPMAAQAPRLQKALADTQRSVAAALVRANNAASEHQALRALIAGS